MYLLCTTCVILRGLISAGDWTDTDISRLIGNDVLIQNLGSEECQGH